jgi:hypothetical protein
MVTLLCAAGAGFATAAVSPVARHETIAAPPVTLPPATRPAAEPAITDQAVQQAMQAVLPSTQAGFEVFDRATATVLISHNADQQVAAMSVVKLLIALDVLAANSWALPDEQTQQELQEMLSSSDDEIADELWVAGGGPSIVTRMASLLGLSGTQPPDDPGQWGDTLITPHDVVSLYCYITDQLPEPGRALLLNALHSAPRIAADGFDQYFGIPSALPRATWAVKQGWGTSGSYAVMNSTGLVGPDQRYAVVVLACAPAGSYARLPEAVTAAASALASVLDPASL